MSRVLPLICPRCRKQMHECECDPGRRARYTEVLLRATRRVSIGEEERYLKERISLMRGTIVDIERELEILELLHATVAAAQAPRPGQLARSDGSD